MIIGLAPPILLAIVLPNIRIRDAMAIRPTAMSKACCQGVTLVPVGVGGVGNWDGPPAAVVGEFGLVLLPGVPAPPPPCGCAPEPLMPAGALPSYWPPAP